MSRREEFEKMAAQEAVAEEDAAFAAAARTNQPALRRFAERLERMLRNWAPAISTAHAYMLDALLERAWAEAKAGLSHVTCAVCGKTYDSPPCDLVDHIEAHEAIRAVKA